MTTNMTTNIKSSDRFIPWYFVLFFIVLTIIYGIMISFAVKTQTGMVTEHPYEKGLNYNKTIELANTQDSLGWKSNIDIEFNSLNNKIGKLKFTISDANKKLILADKVVAKIVRPTQGNMDFNINLSPDKNGGFEAEIKFPQEGLWEIRIYTKSANNNYQTSKRLVVK